MKILEFIFKLLYQFIQFEPGRYEELKEKAFAWQNKVEKEADGEGEKKWFHKIIRYDKEWYFQLLLAILFLFAVKSVRSWLLSDGTDTEDDDDDDEDERPLRKSQLSKLATLIPQAKF